MVTTRRSRALKKKKGASPVQEHAEDLLGCVLWLKTPEEAGQALPDGLPKNGCNHPCVVVDVIPTDVPAEQRYRICM
jgi:hypothetical protein